MRLLLKVNFKNTFTSINMAQSTRSTMLEFSYNKTIDWLKSLSEEREQALVSLAQQRQKDIVHEII